MIELSPQFVEAYAASQRKDRIRFFRELTCSQRGQLGALLFERECEIIKSEILRQMPQASEVFVRDVLRMNVRMIHGDD